MKSHETISIFYKKAPKYNPQMRSGSPYKCKQGKQSGAFGNSIKQIVTENNGQRYPLSVLQYDSTNGRNLHPTQKPVPLLEYLIKTYTDEGDLVLDNCMGSGSTGVACVNTGRDFIGIEKDEKYFSIAQERIERARGQFRLTDFPE